MGSVKSWGYRLSLLLVLLICSNSLFGTFVHAATAQSPVRYHNNDGTVTTKKPDGSTTTEKKKGSGSSSSGAATPAAPAKEDSSFLDFGITDKINELSDTIADIFKTLKDFMSGKLMFDAFVGFMVLLGDSAVNQVYDLFEKSFLFTPRVAEIQSVQDGWTFFVYISLIILLISIMMVIISVLRGNASPGPLIKVIAICFLCSLFSLTIINVLNVLLNWGIHSTINYLMDGTGITYAKLNGQEVLKALIVGEKGISGETFKEETVMKILSGENGGLFTMVFFSVLVILPLSMFTVVKVIALLALAIGCALYICAAALTGKVEPIIGFMNIFVRTLIACYSLAAFWAGMAKLQTDTMNEKGLLFAIGFPAMWVVIIGSTLLSIGLYHFWIKPLVAAVKDPVNLAGGLALEGLGNVGEKMSDFLGNVGDRFGLKGLQKRADKWKKSSQEMANHGIQMQNEREKTKQMKQLKKAALLQDGEGVETAQQQIAAPTDWIAAVEDIQEDDVIRADFKEMSLLETGPTLQKMMKKEGFETLTGISLDKEATQKASQWLDKLTDKQKAALNVKQYTSRETPDGGIELTTSGKPDALLKAMEKEGIEATVTTHYDKNGLWINGQTGHITTDGTVEAENALETLQESYGTYERVDMPIEQAKEALKKAKKAGAEWAKYAIMQEDGLWVTSVDLDQASIDLGTSRGTVTDIQKVSLPEGSQFMNQMLDDWEQSGLHHNLLSKIRTEESDSELFIPAEYFDEFEQAYEEYRTGRPLYWTTKNGEIKVIQDQVAVNYGTSPPANGLDMGSFEKYAKRQKKQDLKPRRVSATNPPQQRSPKNNENSAKSSGPKHRGTARDLFSISSGSSPSTTESTPSEEVKFERRSKKKSVKPIANVPGQKRKTNSAALPAGGWKNKASMRQATQGKGADTVAGATSAPVPNSAATKPPMWATVMPGQKRVKSIQGRNQPKRTVKTARIQKIDRPKSDAPKNEAQKEVAKQAAKDGAKAGVKAGIIAGAATLATGGGTKQAAAQAAKSGGKAALKATQKSAQRNAEKAVVKDTTNTLSRRTRSNNPKTESSPKSTSSPNPPKSS